jgi:hypothetical protein
MTGCQTDTGRLDDKGDALRPAAGSSAYPIINVVFLAILLGGTLLLGSLEVTAHDTVRVPWLDQEMPATCVYVVATGRPCPSCGITRSLIAVVHGDLERSYRFHRAGLAILLMLLIQCGMRVVFLWPRFRRPALDVVVSCGMVCYFAWLLNSPERLGDSIFGWYRPSSGLTMI